MQLGGGPKCPKCTKTVYFNEEFLLGGEKYHKACSVCVTCNKGLDSTCFKKCEGELYCSVCYNKKVGILEHTNSIGQTSISQPKNIRSQIPPGITDPNAPVASTNQVEKGSDVCPRCKKRAYAAERISALNYNWHKYCYKCKTCNKVLDSMNAAERENEPYCKGCYAKQFGPKGYGYGGGAGTLAYTE